MSFTELQEACTRPIALTQEIKSFGDLIQARPALCAVYDCDWAGGTDWSKPITAYYNKVSELTAVMEAKTTEERTQILGFCQWYDDQNNRHCYATDVSREVVATIIEKLLKCSIAAEDWTMALQCADHHSQRYENGHTSLVSAFLRSENRQGWQASYEEARTHYSGINEIVAALHKRHWVSPIPDLATRIALRDIDFKKRMFTYAVTRLIGPENKEGTNRFRAELPGSFFRHFEMKSDQLGLAYSLYGDGSGSVEERKGIEWIKTTGNRREIFDRLSEHAAALAKMYALG